MNTRTVTRLEAPEEMECLQNDLRQLAIRAVDADQYASLANCTPEHCGCDKCVEACWRGTRRRRLREVPAAYRLLKEVDGPVIEIRIARSSWRRPIGQLREL